MSKMISLTKGYSAIVDDEDFEEISKWKWCAFDHSTRNTVYAGRATRNGSAKATVHLHRQILRAKRGEVVDHINGDGLDNRRSNLRITDKTGNARNRSVQANSRSGYKGVNIKRGRKSGRAYSAHITLGSFFTPEEAALAYNKWATLIHGEHARLNVVPNSALGRESIVA